MDHQFSRQSYAPQANAEASPSLGLLLSTFVSLPPGFDKRNIGKGQTHLPTRQGQRPKSCCEIAAPHRRPGCVDNPPQQLLRSGKYYTFCSRGHVVDV